MDRDILHLAIPAFPIALARAGDPSLRARPVAVAPLHSERALLLCCSAEARREGVREGMPALLARRLCPSLRLLAPDPARDARAMEALAEMAAFYTPLWEPAAPGRLFLDLSGSRRLFGPPRDAALRLEREAARRLALAGLVGVAGNKLVSRVAARCLEKPGVCDVLRGSEGSFLAPLPVSVLPGVGRARERLLLADLALARVEEVAALSLSRLRLAFGPFAPLLHQRARGIDLAPVRPPRRVPAVEEEAFLPREENDDGILQAELARLAEGCGLALRRMGKGARQIALAVRYADGLEESRALDLPSPVLLDLDLFAAAETLFREACARRTRVKALRLSCRRLEEPRRQMGLFPDPRDPSPRREALQSALDRLREKHGKDAVRWGKTFF